jgi:drug/metabolite transporter (DMT)-like permease
MMREVGAASMRPPDGIADLKFPGAGQHLSLISGGKSSATRTLPEISDGLRGILLMCAGVATFPFMNAAVKLLTAHYPAAQITWARFTGHLIVMLIVFLPRYRWTLLRTRRLTVQIGRSILMLASNLLFVMAIGTVPLATASAIGFTAPLIVTALSVPLLRESVGWRRWSAVLVGFAGALMVIRPGSGFTDPSVLLLLASSLAYALYQIATRWVGRYDNAATGIIFTALFGSLAMSLAMPFVFVMPLTLLDGLLFGCLGFLGGFGHYLVIRAFQFGAAAVIAPLGYVELVGTTVLGYLIFANFPDLWTWLGAGLIIASGVYIAWRERRRKVART